PAGEAHARLEARVRARAGAQRRARCGGCRAVFEVRQVRRRALEGGALAADHAARACIGVSLDFRPAHSSLTTFGAGPVHCQRCKEIVRLRSKDMTSLWSWHMKTRLWLAAALIALAALGLRHVTPVAQAAPDAQPDGSTLDDQVDLAVTVYNSDIALVRDV